ncbi:PAS domain-containing protein [Novosphingobium sp.]|uniref:PAS domain-containing protein n=1 Tax=Novosphingobium sp. TaxID=1874826 RepID=UPI0028AFAB06|nr:PAS domain-containing protein [Novosphingobium sp.]
MKSAGSADSQVKGLSDTDRVRLALAAGAIVGTWFWDVASDKFTFDEQFADAFGVDPALGDSGIGLEQIVATVHPDDREGLSAAIDDALSRGGTYAHHYRVKRRDGTYHWIEANGRVETDPETGSVTFPGVLIDIDERHSLMEERDSAMRLLEAFIEAVPGVVYAKDRQGRMMVANRGASELVGRPIVEMIGKTDLETLGNSAEAAGVMERDAAIMTGGEVVQIEEQISYPDGREAVWLSTKAPFRDEDGQVVGLIGSSVDITGRRATEAELRETEERYRLAARATNDAVWDWRIADGHVVWNEALERRYGHAYTETGAQWWLDHIHPDDRDRVDHEIHAAIDGEGTAWTSEYRFRTSDGAYADVLDRGFVLRAEDGRPVRMIGAMQDLTERRVREAAVRESEERARLATEAAAIGTWNLDLRSGELRWDARTKALFGLSPKAAVTYEGTFLNGLHPDDRAATEAAVAAAIAPGGTGQYHIEYRTLGIEDGVERWVAARGRSVFTESGEPLHFIGTVVDITELKRTEARLRELNETLEARVAAEVAERSAAQEALRQSQKMEAVGQLTGGIAHDFNNMLAVVIGSLDLLGRRVGEADTKVRRYIDAATEGAQRAATLTQRLLAFSRQQPLNPDVVDANKLVPGMSELLRHSLGADIRLETVLAPGLWRTHADRNQLENAILNLAVNARDAMPDGGRLTIETRNAEEQDGLASSGAPAGNYVLIAVSDTGLGMSEEIAAKAFDPFFTTKKVGKGTGLGLSQVYGFVRQSGGHVRIWSEPGQGTVIKLYLPRFTGDDREAAVQHPQELRLGGQQETILVVDDEAAVRQFSVEALRDLGYRVVEADGGLAALRILDGDPEITLLFTDIVMPDINGRKLAEEALRRRPDLKILYTSGYTRNAVVHNGVVDSGVELIGKPFTIEQLAIKLRAILDIPG